MTPVFQTLSPPPRWLQADLATAEQRYGPGGRVLVLNGGELDDVRNGEGPTAARYWQMCMPDAGGVFARSFLSDASQFSEQATIYSDVWREPLQEGSDVPGTAFIMRSGSSAHVLSLYPVWRSSDEMTSLFLQIVSNDCQRLTGVNPNRVVFWHELGHRDFRRPLTPGSTGSLKDEELHADRFAIVNLSRDEAVYLLDLRAVTAFLDPVHPHEVDYWNTLSLAYPGINPWEEVATVLELKSRVYGGKPLADSPCVSAKACFQDRAHAYDRAVFRSQDPAAANPFSRVARLRKLAALVEKPPPFFTFPYTAELATRTLAAARRLLKPAVFQP